MDSVCFGIDSFSLSNLEPAAGFDYLRQKKENPIKSCCGSKEVKLTLGHAVISSVWVDHTLCSLGNEALLGNEGDQ